MDTQPDVFTPAKLGAVTLRDRIIKDATFEALTPVADSRINDSRINDSRINDSRINKVMRRALFAEPDLINRIRAEAVPGSVRSAGMPSNNVMATIYGHTRCVVTGAPDSLPVRG